MKKVFVDTNIWLRFLVADNEKQFKDCQSFLKLAEEGKFRLYTSNIVFLEIIFTLMSFYKISKNQVLADIEKILSSRNLTLIEKTNFTLALNLFRQFSIKLADCLIAAQLPPKTVLCTYDVDFKKIKAFQSLTPAECLNL